MLGNPQRERRADKKPALNTAVSLTKFRITIETPDRDIGETVYADLCGVCKLLL